MHIGRRKAGILVDAGTMKARQEAAHEVTATTPTTIARPIELTILPTEGALQGRKDSAVVQTKGLRGLRTVLLLCVPGTLEFLCKIYYCRLRVHVCRPASGKAAQKRLLCGDGSRHYYDLYVCHIPYDRCAGELPG